MGNITLIVGDPHLGKGMSLGKPGLGTQSNSRLIDQINLLDWILDKIDEHNVDTLIFTGDMFEDSKPDYNIVKILFDFLKKCEVSNIETHIIVGNHDIRRTGAYHISVLDLIESQEPEYVHVHKQITTILKDGVGFTLLPFRDRKSFNCETHDEAISELAERLPYELLDIPDGFDKVLIGHLALEGSIFVGDEIDDFANELMCPLSLFKGFDYVWHGHVHKPQIRSKKPYVAHIGSLDISDFGEIDHTKIIVLYDPKLPNKFIEIPVPSRPLRKIIISVPITENNTTNFIIKEINKSNVLLPLQNAIVKIEIKLEGLASKNSKRSEIESLVYKLGAHYICNFSESRNASVIPITKKTDMVDNSISPKAAIKLYADTLTLSDDDKTAYIDYSVAIIDKLKR